METISGRGNEMSYLPKLSEKAKREIFIRIIQSRTDFYPLSEAFYEAFRDLFDLEKYPITNEMMFEYIKKLDGWFDLQPNSDSKNFCFVSDRDEYVEIDNFMTIRDMVYEISRFILKRDIDIVGDIHGWWKQPQTY